MWRFTGDNSTWLKKKIFCKHFWSLLLLRIQHRATERRTFQIITVFHVHVSVNHSNTTVNSFLFILSVFKLPSHPVFRYFCSYFSHKIWKRREGLEWRTERQLKDIWESCNILKKNLRMLRYNSKSLFPSKVLMQILLTDLGKNTILNNF